MSVRVLHCDDSAAFRALLRAALEAEESLEIVGEAASNDMLIAETQRLHPDVVLLDMLADGETTIAELQAVDPGVRIVMLSGHPAGYGRQMRPGATAYVEKGAPIETLIAAITDA